MQQSNAMIYFHDKETSPSTGLEYTVGSSTAINFEFETSGSFTAVIEAKVNSQSPIWKPIMVADLATLDLNTTVSKVSHIYQADVTGIEKIRINLIDVGGEISVFAKCVG